MVEFAVVLMITRIAKKRNHITLAKNKTTKIVVSDNGKYMTKTISDNNLEAPSPLVSENEAYTNSKEVWYSTTDVIDFAAFFIFFFSYLTFSVAYMSYNM